MRCQRYADDKTACKRLGDFADLMIQLPRFWIGSYACYGDTIAKG